MWLGTELATLDLAPRLIELAGAPDPEARWYALIALARIGAVVPRTTLVALVARAIAEPFEGGEVYRILQLVGQLDEEVAGVLDQLDLDARRQLVIWYTYIRPRGGEAMAQALQRRWGVETYDDLVSRRSPAEPLSIATRLLLDQLGAERLRRLLHHAVTARSFKERCSILDVPDDRNRYRAALQALRELPEMPPVLAGLLGGVELGVDVHADLIEIALDIDRTATLRHVARHPDVWRSVARMLARQPQPGDRAFFEAAARSSDVETAYHALDGLDGLDGLDIPVHMSSAAPLLAVRFAAAGARRADPAAMAALLEATCAPGVMVRAGAVHRLGRIDRAGAHVAVLERALFDDEAVAWADAWRLPVAERAAVALAAAPGARSSLLRRFFTTENETLCEIIVDSLAERLEDLPSWSPFDFCPEP